MEYKNYFEMFSSVRDYSRALETRTKNNVLFNSNRSETHPEWWCTTASYNVADNLLKFGDKANFEKIKAYTIKNSLDQKASTVLKFEKSVCGIIPIVGAFLSGSPKCMLATKKVAKENRIYNIYIDTSVHKKVESDKIIEIGARIVALIGAIEAKQVRCNVFVGASACEFSQTITHFICVKKANQAFNKLALAYFLINPSFLRRHNFRYLECFPGVLDPAFRRDVYCSSLAVVKKQISEYLNNKVDNTYFLSVGKLCAQQKLDMQEFVTNFIKGDFLLEKGK